MDLKARCPGNGRQWAGLGPRICYALAKQGVQIAVLCPERRVDIAT
jgi:hypothetical protein